MNKHPTIRSEFFGRNVRFLPPQTGRAGFHNHTGKERGDFMLAMNALQTCDGIKVAQSTKEHTQ